jgi:ATP diphosphatase
VLLPDRMNYRRKTFYLVCINKRKQSAAGFRSFGFFLTYWVAEPEALGSKSRAGNVQLIFRLTRSLMGKLKLMNNIKNKKHSSNRSKNIKHLTLGKKRKTAAKIYKNADQRNQARNSGKLFEDLVALQARLRAPGGCPWDREQTHESLRTYLIEEAYEVLDALESGNAENFAGELGDLLLQVIFHSGLAAEAGRFDISDVIERVHDKMVRRHPHVFGTVQAKTSAQVLKNWEQLKAEERRKEKKSSAVSSGKPKLGSSKAPETASILDAVPRTLPALLEAHQLTRRAANVGFDWQQVEGIFEKLTEETVEIRKALAAGDRVQLEEETGDLLFVCVNLARFLGLDAEITLKKANSKFSRRFRQMEHSAASSRQTLSTLSPDQLEALWNQAKARERDMKYPPKS